MARRVLVCLSQAGATAARWSGRLTEVASFNADSDGLEAFDAWLARLSGTPATVMVDGVEEDYRFETLPHTTGRDRQELLARKLKQMFRGTPFTSASIVAPASSKTSGRREDQVLFCALTAAEIIAPWLHILRERGLPLVAVHPLPTVTPAAAKLLKLESPNLLLISRHRAGLRQTFLKNGTFRITRLTPPQAAEEWDLETSFASEVRNTRLYLDSQAITTTDDILQVVILDQDDSLVLLQERIEALGGTLRCRRWSRADLADRLGVPAAVLENLPDALHLRLLGGKVSAPSLASADMVSDYRLYRMQRLLFAASSVVAAAGGLYFGAAMYRASGLAAEAVEAFSTTQRYRKQYEQLTRSFPAAPASAAVLQKTVELAQRLRDTAPTPEPLLVAVSQALETAPSITLQVIDWRHGKADPFGAFGNPNAAGSSGPGTLAVGMVSGEISPFDGNYRAAVDTIRQFAERLRANPAVAQVRVVKYPLDDSSQQVLSGSTGARSERKSAALFELAVQMRQAGGGM